VVTEELMNTDIKKVLISKEDIDKKVQKLGKLLAVEYQDKRPILICVLKGAVLFLTDLMRAMDIPLDIEFMDVSSYGNSTTSSGSVKILKDLDCDIAERDVLIVEDILDTGLTLSCLIRMLQERNPNSIKICSLLVKRKSIENHSLKVQADYIGFDIPDEFVVGYGLDYAEKYRNLPYIGVLKEEMYQ